MKLEVGDTVLIGEHPLVPDFLPGTKAYVVSKFGSIVRVNYRDGELAGMTGDLTAEALVIVPPDCDCRAAELNAPYHSRGCELRKFLKRKQK